MKITDELLTFEQVRNIEIYQQKDQEAWKNRNPNGEKIRQFGIEITVLPRVPPPGYVSKMVVENFPELRNLSVLDCGCGSGVIGLLAAKKGANKVTCIDISPDAVICAILNANNLNIGNTISVIESNLFAKLKPYSKFNKIFANLPFRNKVAPDLVAASHWDTGFNSHNSFFADAANYLTDNGEIYMPYANYPELPHLINLIEENGFVSDVLQRRKFRDDDPRIYYLLKIQKI